MDSIEAWKEFESELNAHGITGKVKLFVPVSGGDINSSYRVEFGSNAFFLKSNFQNRYPGMFQAEDEGLSLLAETGVRIPKVVLRGSSAKNDFLLMEWISAPRQPKNWTDAAKGLALIHRKTGAYFGLPTDNYIGSLRQVNEPRNSWKEFYLEMRLMKQLQLAVENGLVDGAEAMKMERCFERIVELFPIESPSLVHGDLWGGNMMFSGEGGAVFIDPAVYYGHREMDFAMTKLFGGFPEEFYSAYEEAFPLEAGWENRIALGQLYPLLVHLNLFGGSYLPSITAICGRYGL